MPRLLLAGVVIAIAGAAAFVHSGVYDVGASSPHAGATAWLLSRVVDASVERRAADVEVPDLEREDLQLTGASDFDFMCASCHGAPGRRVEPVGAGLNPAPPDLADSALHHTPGELFWVTKHGIRMTGMPAWGATHADGDLWPLVAFMQVLPGLDAAAYRSMLGRAEGKGHHAAQAAAGPQAETGEPKPVKASGHDHAGHAH